MRPSTTPRSARSVRLLSRSTAGFSRKTPRPFQMPPMYSKSLSQLRLERTAPMLPLFLLDCRSQRLRFVLAHADDARGSDGAAHDGRGRGVTGLTVRA